jgi:hypothetical protein
MGRAPGAARRAVTLPLLLLALAWPAAAGAQLVEMPTDERAMMRAYAQWWMMQSRGENSLQTFGVADRSFDRGNFNIARKRYLILALHGDKFAQFRLGLIALEQDDPVDAWAWFRLANEDGAEPAFAPYPDQVWSELDGRQRRAAEARLAERSARYSDYAVAERMNRIFRRNLRATTGSRLGYVGNLLINGGATNAERFYDRVKSGLDFTDRVLDRYGTVRLGELELIDDEGSGDATPEPSRDD